MLDVLFIVGVELTEEDATILNGGDQLKFGKTVSLPHSKFKMHALSSCDPDTDISYWIPLTKVTEEEEEEWADMEIDLPLVTTDEQNELLNYLRITFNMDYKKCTSKLFVSCDH